MNGEPNIGARVRVRLLRLAKQRGDDFQLVLLRFVHERLLYRLASSSHAGNFVLKGAALFTVWTGRPHRATRDLDLLGFGDATEAHLRTVFAEIATTKTADDGVTFDPATIETETIRAEDEYGGVRVHLEARVATARIRLQVDIGFGDAITPGASVVEFPALLDFPAPHLRAYPRETVVAEKVEAMVKLGLANSRMKDFYDLAVLARRFPFDGAQLASAIRATFERRGTALPEGTPVALTADFASAPGKTAQWSGFKRKAAVEDAGSLGEVLAEVTAFVSPPLLAARTSTLWSGFWPAGGPWSLTERAGGLDDMRKLAVEFHDATVKAIHRRGGDLVLDLSVYVHRSEKRPGGDDGDGWYQDAEARLLGGIPQQEPARLPLDVTDGGVTVDGTSLADLLPLPCDMTGSVEIELSGPEGVLRATGSGLLVTLKGEPGPVEEFRRANE